MTRCVGVLAAFLLLDANPTLAGGVMDDAAVYDLVVDSAT